MNDMNDTVVELTSKIDTERRKEPRRRVLKNATISFNRGYGAFEGVIRSQSPSGARLSFGDALGLPPRFVLDVPGDARTRLAEVRWRSDGDVGVELIEEAP
ncbi:PilZ domain-containing protein [Mesorhizobium xinjiangense]|uniref:PilZ domain-containing protein n=1 Tax=Mesorhizobium xinjiangense TaxID=2678685 RepID=UPI0012ED47B8|nr:PilZ domain-containing protein [Mesorhizobium xinjiangense]